jgi:hypothetical protein
MTLMGKDKSTILYSLKFGYGSFYKGKITNKTLSMIVSENERKTQRIHKSQSPPSRNRKG